MKNLGYYNGAYDELEKMSVPMLDRVCYFGDGIYDATYSRNHIIYALDEHIDRFYNSAKLLDINIPHTKDEMKEILCEMVKKVDDGSQFVYIQATRGTGIRNHVYDDGTPANIWIMLKPLAVKDTYQKIKLITLEDKRFLYCNVKTLNLIPSVLYAKETDKAGCDEAVLHRGARVTSDVLDGCKVYNYESGRPEEIGVYNMEKAYGKDPYEMFLSGSLSLITIENPNATTDKELVIFRDSFGSSIAPLLVEGYAKITLVDIRYITSDLVGRFIDFENQDVLFLYSTLVLNNSVTLK